MTLSTDHINPAGKRNSVSVVCPFFNEEALICEAADRMIEALTAAFSDWELILVDDGSTDRSREFLERYLSEHSEARVVLLSYHPNQGRGRALKVGIDAAHMEIIVTTEADLSWGGDIVQRLYDALDSAPTAHFVIGSPQLAGRGYEGVPLSRRLLSRIGNHSIRLFFNSGLTMHTGMTRAYRREVIQPLVCTSKDKEFHLEVLLKLLTIGFCPIEIPATIDWGRRNALRGGRAPAGMLTGRMLHMIAQHLIFLAIAQPMRNFSIFAMVASLGGFAFGTTAVWELLTGGIAVNFALVAMFLFLFSLLFIGFAVIFSQIRDQLRVQWIAGYSSENPAAPKISVVRPVAADISKRSRDHASL